MNKYQSLHSHTTSSDGKLSHLELLNQAKNHNVGVIAFTDHDSVMPIEIIESLKNHSVNWISGIEMSSGLPKELGISPDGPHIVGLFVDPTNPDLIEYCHKAQAARLKLMTERVVKLQQLGFNVTIEDCLKASNGETVGRPHLVQAINSHPENEAVMQSLIEKMREASLSDPKIKEKFDLMMNSGPRQYPYVLFLSDDSFIPGINGQREYWKDFDECVSLIRNAGGVAFFAHYSSERKKVPLEALEKLLKENRIDGVETVYGLWELGTPRQNETDSDKQVIKTLLNKYDKLPSGGADMHTLDDLINFSSNKDYASQTIGLVENIIAKLHVKTTWSNLK